MAAEVDGDLVGPYKHPPPDGCIVIGSETVDVPAAFEPFVGKQWAVVGSTNHPTEWPAFFDAAQALGWEFRYAHLRDGWAYLYFQKLRRTQTSLRDLVMK